MEEGRRVGPALSGHLPRGDLQPEVASGVESFLKAAGEVRYYSDSGRHLICVPYGVPELHAMADALNIRRCWYHGGRHPHYDIPKHRVREISLHTEVVPSRVILRLMMEAKTQNAESSEMIGTRLAVIVKQLDAVIDGRLVKTEGGERIYVDVRGAEPGTRKLRGQVYYGAARGTELHRLLKGARYQARRLGEMAAQLAEHRQALAGRGLLGPALPSRRARRG